MTKRFTTKIVEDIVSEGVSDREISQLLDLAAYAVESIAPTLAKTAGFDMSDFSLAKQRGVSGYELLLTRENTKGHESWVAEFKSGDKSVRILLAVSAQG